MTVIARSRNGKTFDMEKRQISIIHDLYYPNRKAATKADSMPGIFRMHKRNRNLQKKAHSPCF